MSKYYINDKIIIKASRNMTVHYQISVYQLRFFINFYEMIRIDR